MNSNEEYLKGYFTVIDANGYKRTFQSYHDPFSEKTRKKSVSWKKRNLKSERQALKYLKNEIEKELFEQPQKVNIKIDNFGELVDLWKRVWAPTVRETSVESQMKLVESYIYPYVPRNLALRNLDTMFVELAWSQLLDYRTKKKKEPLQKSSLEQIRTLFRQITYYGFRNGFISVNFFDLEMKIPLERGIKAKAKRKKKFLDNKEVKILLSCIREKHSSSKHYYPLGMFYYDLVDFMVRTGLRISEVSALTISKIDFDKKTLAIEEALHTSRKKVDDYALNPPKTAASDRIINLDDKSIEILLRRLEFVTKRREDAERRIKGEPSRVVYKTENGEMLECFQKKRPLKNFNYTDYIFQTENGNPVTLNAFNQFINGHGLNCKRISRNVMDIIKEKYPSFDKHVTSHTFRYTHISLLAQAGMPLKAIMERVGHEDSKITLEVYNQVSEITREKIASEITSWDFDE